MKILIADFQIAKYGGIISYVNAMIKAALNLGHEIDIVQLTPSSITQKSYNAKIKKIENKKFQENLKKNSQNGGYEKSVLGYYENHYYGFFLPPSNRIGVFESDALEHWKKLTKNVDIILWNFMPTKSSSWIKKDKEFNFWYKFYDLPDKIKQVFLVHDAYFNIRASNISALKDKINFLGCAHLAAYHCCEEINIPRTLLLNPRYLKDDSKMKIKNYNNRKIDFFAAHIFKSMKHMDDLIKSIPYLNNKTKYNIEIAGSGIEQAYMVAPEKCKECYKVSLKKDPDAKEKWLGKKIWDMGEKFGMNYLGQISGDEVKKKLINSKFAIDPSWAKHYSNYCKTHINGFIIEAMLNGCYPVIRDYNGLTKNMNDIYDPLFDEIRAIKIPWDATPKQFSKHLKNALKMCPSKYLNDTKHNYEIVRNLFNAKDNLKEIIRLCKMNKKTLESELKTGTDSDNVKRITKEIMEDFFKIELPISWEQK